MVEKDQFSLVAPFAAAERLTVPESVCDPATQVALPESAIDDGKVPPGEKANAAGCWNGEGGVVCAKTKRQKKTDSSRRQLWISRIGTLKVILIAAQI